MNFKLKLFVAIMFMLTVGAPVFSQITTCEMGAYRSERGEVVVLTTRQISRQFRYVFAGDAVDSRREV